MVVVLLIEWLSGALQVSTSYTMVSPATVVLTSSLLHLLLVRGGGCRGSGGCNICGSEFSGSRGCVDVLAGYLGIDAEAVSWMTEAVMVVVVMGVGLGSSYTRWFWRW